jgi:hypothetical protein
MMEGTMLRHFECILGIMVLFALTMAWTEGKGGAALVSHPRGWIAVGTRDGALIGHAIWEPAIHRNGWEVKKTWLVAHRTCVEAMGNSRYFLSLRVPIWLVMLAVASLTSWRWIRWRRRSTGFPLRTGEGMTAEEQTRS